MSGSTIAAEIAAAIAEAGSATGTGPLNCTIRQIGPGPQTPWDATPEGAQKYFNVVAVRSNKRAMDGGVPVTVQTLKMDALSVEPRPQDHVAIGITSDQVTGSTSWVEITDVKTTAPGGVPLMYEVTLSAG